MARLFPIGMQTFSEIRECNAIYVDKTEKIHKLVTEGKVYFLSRPRRFGKSLLISTLESYFEGRKELFEGLAIEKLEKQWAKYPVLRIDFSAKKAKTLQAVQSMMRDAVEGWEKLYGTNTADKDDYAMRFKKTIESAYEKTGQKVVVLIDEYDAPLLDTVQDETFYAICNQMRDFFSPLKACDAKLRFVFLTGITKFSQLSIFSELNNLKNISMLDDYCDLCGISVEEMQEQMQPELQEMAQKLEVSQDELLARLKRKYDGYHFSPHSKDIFNPFSLLNSLKDKEFGNYWFSSGTPTHLIEKIKQQSVSIEDLDSGTPMTLETFDIPIETADSVLPLLFQSGYITIKSFREDAVRQYTLGYPNEEVRKAFVNLLAINYAHTNEIDKSIFVENVVNAFRNNKIDDVFTIVRAFMSSIPYDAEAQNELHYRTIIYLIFRIAAPYLVRCEERSAAGRSDLVVETADNVYVIEIKLDGTVEQALQQIDDKGYLLPYSANGKKLHKIGVNFDKETRTIGEWKIVDMR